MRKYIDIISENVEQVLAGTFYHGTSTGKGRPTSGLYVGNSPHWAAYYARNAAEQHGGEPIVLTGRIRVSNPAIVGEDQIEYLGYEADDIRQLADQGHDAAMRQDGVEMFLFSHDQFEVQDEKLLTEAVVPKADRLLLIVHPGSACGSADFNIGQEEAEASRSELISDITAWNGPTLVLDGNLSIELRRYAQLGQAISQCVARDLSSLRTKACAEETPGWVKKATKIVQQMVMPGGSVLITGAWRHMLDEEGCCNAMFGALSAAGFKAVYLPSAIVLDADPNDSLNEKKAAAPVIRFLYHGTSSSYLGEILSGEINEPSYWGTKAIASHFARMKCQEEGGETIVIEMPIRFFDKSMLRPDENLMDFPINFHDDASQEARFSAWRRSKKDWQACMRIFGATLYLAPMDVLPHMIRKIT